MPIMFANDGVHFLANAPSPKPLELLGLGVGGAEVVGINATFQFAGKAATRMALHDEWHPAFGQKGLVLRSERVEG